MENPNVKFSEPGKLIIDLFSSTFAIAVARLELPWHHRIIGCKGNAEYFAASTEAPV